MTRNGGNLRQAILDEARKVLLDEGYTRVSMRRIATAVGCTPTSIYLYFRDKDDLIHTLIDEGMERLHQVLVEGLDATRDPVQRVERICRRYLEFGLENPEYYEIMFLLHPKRMERYPAEKYRRARRNLEVFFDALAAMHGAAPGSREDWVLPGTVIWTFLHGLASLLIAQRIDVSIDRTALLNQAVRVALQMALGSTVTERMDTQKPR